MGRIVSSKDLQRFLDESPSNKKGCFVDTNLLFASDYDLHPWNDEAVKIIDVFGSNQIGIFSNSIIRSELIELKRRVLITESLKDFFDIGGRGIPPDLHQKLKTHRDTIVAHEKKGTHYFLSDNKIKTFRKSLRTFGSLFSATDFLTPVLSAKTI